MLFVSLVFHTEIVFCIYPTYTSVKIILRIRLNRHWYIFTVLFPNINKHLKQTMRIKSHAGVGTVQHG